MVALGGDQVGSEARWLCCWFTDQFVATGATMLVLLEVEEGGCEIYFPWCGWRVDVAGGDDRLRVEIPFAMSGW